MILTGSVSNFYTAATLNYDGLSSLTAIESTGSLTLNGGRTFTPFGPFTNGGNLTVDSSSSFGVAPAGPLTTAGLVSSYSAEGNANDGTGTNHGTLNNGATFGTGISGQAFALDGVNDYVSIPDSANLRNANLTTEAWFKFNSIPTGLVGIIGKALGTGTQNSYAIWYTGGQLNYGISDGGFASTSIAFTPFVGVFYHVAMTFDDANNTVTLYLDGISRSTISTTRSIVYDTTRPHILGADIENGVLNYFFPGNIDEARIYNRALSATEVRNDYLSIAATRLTQSAGVTTVNGLVTSQNEFTLSGGTLKGNGSIPTNGNNTGAIVAPGNSPGCITINGNYSQAAAGTLQIEVEGPTVCTGYDQLIVNGSVTLAGTLNLVLAPTYTPDVGQQFQIIDNDLSESVNGVSVHEAAGDFPAGEAEPCPPDPTATRVTPSLTS